ncbi:hypothetical protein IVA78_05320 [Bradyrhizobium sp. 137]|uniref:hypothetical protein n=2 Tax=unclassified Bradyrhizobium TaxID=2631580 RepID=UPI001FF887E6|nr:hypothetical protein [Bradyrhizobium sp. 137]MCK1754638.1 hypothetical protein [Bradyrhizobium sp. 137]
MIKISEPFGKRSFLGRSIAISIPAVLRALCHATKTRIAAAEWKLRPPPSKAARTILMAYYQVKPSHDCVAFRYVSDFFADIGAHSSAAHSVTPHRSSSPHDQRMQPPFRRAAGIKGTVAVVDIGGAFWAADCLGGGRIAKVPPARRGGAQDETCDVIHNIMVCGSDVRRGDGRQRRLRRRAIRS